MRRGFNYRCSSKVDHVFGVRAKNCLFVRGLGWLICQHRAESLDIPTMYSWLASASCCRKVWCHEPYWLTPFFPFHWCASAQDGRINVMNPSLTYYEPPYLRTFQFWIVSTITSTISSNQLGPTSSTANRASYIMASSDEYPLKSIYGLCWSIPVSVDLWKPVWWS